MAISASLGHVLDAHGDEAEDYHHKPKSAITQEAKQNEKW